MPRDNTKFVVIVTGNMGLFPVRQTVTVKGKRKAMAMKRKLRERLTDIDNMRIEIRPKQEMTIFDEVFG